MAGNFYFPVWYKASGRKEVKIMTEVQILDIMYEAFQLAMKLSLPFLLLSMIVGVVIVCISGSYTD